MTFKVIDTKTGKEPTSRVIDNIAKKGGLMIMDIDQFFVGEDGSLVLADDCGNITYCDTKRFTVIPQTKVGHWIKQTLSVKPFGEDTVLCDQCAFMTDKDSTYNYCPNCGAKMVEPQKRSDKE